MARIDRGNFGNQVAPAVGQAAAPRVIGAAYDTTGGLPEFAAGAQQASNTLAVMDAQRRAIEKREAEKALAEQERAQRTEEATRSRLDAVHYGEAADQQRATILADATIPADQKAQRLDEYLASTTETAQTGYKYDDILGAHKVTLATINAAQRTQLQTGLTKNAQAQTQANVAGWLEAKGRQASASGNPEPFIADAERYVDATAAGAGWDPAEAHNIKQRIGESWTENTVAARINTDPDGALRDLRAGQYNRLDPKVKIALESRAQAEIEQRENRARIEAEARANKAGRAVEGLDWYYSKGMQPPPQLVATAAALAKGTEYEGEIDQMQGNAAERASFATKPLAEQAADIERGMAQATDPATGIPKGNARSLLWKDQQHAAIIADIKERGPLAAAASRGIVDITPIDVSDPDAIRLGLLDRNDQAEKAAVWAGQPVSPLTNDETKRFGRAFDNADATGRLRMLDGLSKAMGDPVAFRATMTQLAPGHGVLASAGNMMQDENSRAAELMVTGEVILKPPEATGGKAPPMPPAKSMEAAFNGATAGMFEGNAEDRDRLYQSSRAVYAALGQEAGDYSDVVNPDRWRQAIDTAAGGIVDLDGWFSSGRRVIKPPRMTTEAFTTAVRSASADQVQSLGGVAGYTPDEAAEAIRDGALVNYGNGYAIRDGSHFLVRADGSGPFVWAPR